MSTDEEQVAIARALRALPQLAPPADGWRRLARRLGGAPRRAPRFMVPALAAAALAVAALALAPLLRHAPEQPAALATAAPPAAGPARELEARSADLERLLAALPPARVARASTASTAALLEDRIAFVDERLSASLDGALPPDAARALLRERVTLLDSLVRVRYAASVGQTL